MNPFDNDPKVIREGLENRIIKTMEKMIILVKGIDRTDEGRSIERIHARQKLRLEKLLETWSELDDEIGD